MRTTDDERALELMLRAPGIERSANDEHGLSFQANEHDVAALSLALARDGVGLLALTPELATLEDLFFRLTEGANGATTEAAEVAV